MLYLRNYAVLNVKDQLAKIQGVGDVQLFGSGDYAMRIWLNPREDRRARLDGRRSGQRRCGARTCRSRPASSAVRLTAQGGELQLPINAQGRLTDPDQFRQHHHQARRQRRRHAAEGRGARRDRRVAIRPALAARQQVGGRHSDLPGARLERDPDFQPRPRDHGGAEAEFPGGLDYRIVYDPTVFVRGSIEAVVHTLLEAIALVVLVVILFLQTWRASIIPLLAVPVSIVGTFAVMHLFGFSINALSLFGLVLAIGIVVDDAIVVVENVERNIEAGLSPRDATLKAMSEVTGPDHRHRARALRGVRADRLHQRPDRAILSPVRADHRLLDRHLGVQFADPVAGAGRDAAERP